MAYGALIYHRSIKETIPQRVYDHAAQSGFWKHAVPLHAMRRARGAYRTEAAAIAAMTRYTRRYPTEQPEDWRGLIWVIGRENEDGKTIAI